MNVHKLNQESHTKPWIIKTTIGKLRRASTFIQKGLIRFARREQTIIIKGGFMTCFFRKEIDMAWIQHHQEK